MTLNDFIIIYLACGSPVAVWFYFNNKNADNILFKSLIAAFFWVFFIADFFYKKSSNNFQTPGKLEIIGNFQKEIEKHLPKDISVFEFREITNRYIGLTLAVRVKKKTSHNSNEFSARFNSRNKKISAECLQRRNRQKLKLHQISSRKDFVQTIREISAQIDEPTDFLKLNLEFVKNLNDIKAENLIAEFGQIYKEKSVKRGEQQLWNTEPLNLPTNERTNFHLPASTPQPIQMSTKD